MKEQSLLWGFVQSENIVYLCIFCLFGTDLSKTNFPKKILLCDIKDILFSHFSLLETVPHQLQNWPWKYHISVSVHQRASLENPAVQSHLDLWTVSASLEKEKVFSGSYMNPYCLH